MAGVKGKRPLAYSGTEPKKGDTYFYQGRPVTVMKVAADGTYLVRSWNVNPKLDTWVEWEELRGVMVQLQINITFENGKLNLQLNQLKREDAAEIEIETAKHLEKIVEDILLGAAEQSGFRVRKRRVKAKKDAHLT